MNNLRDKSPAWQKIVAARDKGIRELLKTTHENTDLQDAMKKIQQMEEKMNNEDDNDGGLALTQENIRALLNMNNQLKRIPTHDAMSVMSGSHAASHSHVTDQLMTLRSPAASQSTSRDIDMNPLSLSTPPKTHTTSSSHKTPSHSVNRQTPTSPRKTPSRIPSIAQQLEESIFLSDNDEILNVAEPDEIEINSEKKLQQQESDNIANEIDKLIKGITSNFKQKLNILKNQENNVYALVQENIHRVMLINFGIDDLMEWESLCYKRRIIKVYPISVYLILILF